MYYVSLVDLSRFRVAVANEKLQNLYRLWWLCCTLWCDYAETGASGPCSVLFDAELILVGNARATSGVLTSPFWATPSGCFLCCTRGLRMGSPYGAER